VVEEEAHEGHAAGQHGTRERIAIVRVWVGRIAQVRWSGSAITITIAIIAIAIVQNAQQRECLGARWAQLPEEPFG